MACLELGQPGGGGVAVVLGLAWRPRWRPAQCSRGSGNRVPRPRSRSPDGRPPSAPWPWHPRRAWRIRRWRQCGPETRRAAVAAGAVETALASADISADMKLLSERGSGWVRASSLSTLGLIRRRVQCRFDVGASDCVDWFLGVEIAMMVRAFEGLPPGMPLERGEAGQAVETEYRVVAQLVAQRSPKPQVAGSSPVCPAHGCRGRDGLSLRPGLRRYSG